MMLMPGLTLFHSPPKTAPADEMVPFTATKMNTSPMCHPEASLETFLFADAGGIRGEKLSPLLISTKRFYKTMDAKEPPPVPTLPGDPRHDLPRQPRRAERCSKRHQPRRGDGNPCHATARGPNPSRTPGPTGRPSWAHHWHCLGHWVAFSDEGRLVAAKQLWCTWGGGTLRALVWHRHLSQQPPGQGIDTTAAKSRCKPNKQTNRWDRVTSATLLVCQLVCLLALVVVVAHAGRNNPSRGLFLATPRNPGNWFRFL